MTHISVLHTAADVRNCAFNVKTACRNCGGQKRMAAKKKQMTSLSLMRGTCRHYVVVAGFSNPFPDTPVSLLVPLCAFVWPAACTLV